MFACLESESKCGLQASAVSRGGPSIGPTFSGTDTLVACDITEAEHSVASVTPDVVDMSSGVATLDIDSVVSICSGVEDSVNGTRAS